MNASLSLAPLSLSLALSLALSACGSGTAAAPPAEPPAPPSEAPPVETSSEPLPPTAAQRRPLELTSACLSETTLYLGDTPVAEGEGKRTVPPEGGFPLERRRDGTQVVWLLDEAGKPLIKVDVTRGMKKVEIGKSCRTLDAR